MTVEDPEPLPVMTYPNSPIRRVIIGTVRGRTPDLFPETVPPRQRPRKLMHVVDAGHAGGVGQIVQFQCPRCEHLSDWLSGFTVAEAKRGWPCPKCNDLPPEETL